MVFQNHLADSLLLVLVYCLAKQGKPFLILGERFRKLLRNLADILLPYLLLVRKYRFFHRLRRYNLPNCRKQFLRNRTALIFMLLLAALCHDGIDKCNHLLVHLMGGKNRLNHLLLRNFIGPGLNHNDLLLSRRHRQRKVGHFFLCRRRVKHEFSLD